MCIYTAVRYLETFTLLSEELIGFYEHVNIEYAEQYEICLIFKI